MLLVCAAGAPDDSWHSSAQQSGERRFTADELRAMGKVYMDSVIRVDGLSPNVARTQEVKEIVAQLQRRSGYEQPITCYLLNKKDDLNAFALPGGYIGIYEGTLDVFRQVAKQSARGDTVEENRLYRGFLAATLSHELAHHTLGHTRGRLRMADSMAERQANRERESAADRVGSLYMLWSGWTIQDAMDAQRLFDVMERNSPRFYGLSNLSYNRTHPRSSLREAELEAFRAGLKADQARFDDAITLISSNVVGGQNLAIALLDTVLMHFPYLTEAYHARGTAYLQKFLSSTPPQTLQVQMALPVQAAYFLPRIRGAGALPDPSSLAAARRDFDRAMTLELYPTTVSNLALVDLLSGKPTEAETGARYAVQLAPTSGALHNNLGVVLFHSRKYAEARTSFERARSQDGWENRPMLMFNLGRTLLRLEDARGRTLLEQYVATARDGEWRQLALATLGNSGTGPSAPVAESGSPPAMAGIALMASRDRITATLGMPDVRQAGADGEFWRYDRLGIAVFLGQDQRVRMIALFTRNAGALLGLRVGDPLASSTTRLGAPSVTASGDWYFPQGSWSAFLRPNGEVIAMIGVAAGS